jgi:hypothetical protein
MIYLLVTSCKATQGKVYRYAKVLQARGWAWKHSRQKYSKSFMPMILGSANYESDYLPMNHEYGDSTYCVRALSN